MELKTKMKELLERSTMEEEELELNKEGLLEAGIPEIHIDTVNIHFGDHMESINFMGDAEVETEEEIEETQEPVEEDTERMQEPVEIDTEDMKKAISQIMKIPPCIVGKVFEGMKLYLEALSEVDSDE